MAFVASLLADLPAVGDPATTGYYVQYGDAVIATYIGVTNTDTIDRTIKQMYVTQADTAWGTGAGLSIGEAAFRYISSNLNTTNNVIPAGTGRTIQNLIQPQVNAISWDATYYEFRLIPYVQEVGSANTIPIVAPIRIRIYKSLPVSFKINNPYILWDRSQNKRPPMNDDFDFGLSLTAYLEDGLAYTVPIGDTTWSQTPATYLTVTPSSSGINTTPNPYNPLTQPAEYAAYASTIIFAPSAGSVAIDDSALIGQVTVSVNVAGIVGSVASTDINVVNRQPVSISFNQISVPFRFASSIQLVLFKMFLNYNDGTVEDISISPSVVMSAPSWVNFGGWATTTIGGIDYAAFIITSPGSTYFNIFTPLQLPIKATYSNLGTRIVGNSSLLIQKTT